MLAAAAVAVVAAAGVLVLLRPVVGEHPLLLGAGALATMPIPMATGLCASRVWYPTLVWVLSLVAVLVIALGARRGLGRGALVVATVLGLVACGLLLLRAEPALRANHASFQEVLDQIPATRATGTGTIVFPEEVPHPAYGKEPVFRLPSIACGFRIYYAVPDQVVLDNGTAPAAGLPEYCPRPDAVRRP